jgi:hypothetical protein
MRNITHPPTTKAKRLSLMLRRTTHTLDITHHLAL